MAFMLLTENGAEMSAGGYLSTYSVLKNFETESTGAYLTSCFWGAFTIGRMISIPLSIRIGAKFILFGNFIGMSYLLLF